MYVLPLLLAVVTTALQDSTPPAARPRPARRPHGTAAIALETAAAALAASRADLAAFAAQGPVLATAAMQLEALTVQAPVLAASAARIEQAAIALPSLAVLADVDAIVPPEAWAQQDPADSLYRAARQALNRNRYARAAELFQAVHKRYPRSTYTADAFYWEAFALYRTGSDDGLRAAREALRTQAARFPKASTRHDAEVLLRRVQGQLAQRGDRDAAEAVSAEADSIAPPEPPEPAEPAEPPEPPEPAEAPRGHPPRAPRAPRPPRPDRSSSCDDEDDIRIAALNGLLQMDAERAVPILKAVLARRDEGSACLRRKAVWLVSQKRSPETSAILLNAVRSDPDREVREQGVFWLSQVPGEETAIALDSILRASDDPVVQEKAIFALSQHRSPRAGATLRAYAERRDAPQDLREQAIFWLGQRRSADNAEFLKSLYSKLESDDLKEKVIFSLSQMGGADNYRWMMDIALNQNENIEIRKKALFWAGQGKSVEIADLVRLYDSMKDREMREQLIFVYSQRREDAALEKLFDIGRNDPDRELRKKAVFWIGQSRSPRAAQFLQELINQ